MAYTRPKFQYKKDLKAAVKNGQEVTIFEPGPFPATQNGTAYIEGPNFEPHRWYAEVTVKDGRITSVSA